MTTLREQLTAADTKPAAVADLAALIDGEVAGMSGLTGIAAKTAVKAAKAKRPDVVQRGANAYLGTLADALDPFWTTHRAQGGTDFGAYVAANSDQVSAAVMAAIESEVGTGNQRSMFDKFKPQLGKVLVGALPKIGALVQKHAG
ncbi:hypothetical protein C8046_08060 [Serinibacter arcticus]|uniref:Uncharacterized protein n=1 Tax=Serinibacter arcticus TaxID=1655435 RepID=A0A2U1ZUL3_9MICO|nr:hypothetical protein [Serinibacter arcticus]PWD50612.1 hypothetical protein C8046_08060 [Serinibacter arcticus]